MHTKPDSLIVDLVRDFLKKEGLLTLECIGELRQDIGRPSFTFIAKNKNFDTSFPTPPEKLLSFLKTQLTDYFNSLIDKNNEIAISRQNFDLENGLTESELTTNNIERAKKEKIKKDKEHERILKEISTELYTPNFADEICTFLNRIPSLFFVRNPRDIEGNGFWLDSHKEVHFGNIYGGPYRTYSEKNFGSLKEFKDWLIKQSDLTMYNEFQYKNFQSQTRVLLLQKEAPYYMKNSKKK